MVLMIRNHQLRSLMLLCMPLLFTPCVSANNGSNVDERFLENVTVTAQKREQSLQKIPLAVAILDETQLQAQGISGLDDLTEGTVPMLRVQQYPLTPSSLVIAIRGNGPTDAGQVTREGGVAVYVNGFYRSRAQGLAAELVDLERIEILRGPQGTLFGRNATGGAVNIVGKKPTGEWGIQQTLGAGRYDELTSVTRVNFPSVSGVNAKFDYIHKERDGWVRNLAPGQADYNAYDQDAGQFTLNWLASETVSVDYLYDQSKDEASQLYFQLAKDNIGLLPLESGRQTRTRFPINPLDPTVVEQAGHGLTLNWELSDRITLKSLTSYRELNEKTNFNFGGALYSNGFINSADIDSELLTQEIQLIGTHRRVEWVAGFFYLDEQIKSSDQLYFSLDSFGLITGTPNTPIPLTTFGIPPRHIKSESKSRAIYGQATWKPPALNDKLELTLGLRYNDDTKSGSRVQGTALQTFDTDDGNDTDGVDSTVALSYHWSDQLLTYLKYSSGYQAGGVNIFSASFSDYDREEVESVELGIKSEWFDRHLRLNAALFGADYDGKVLDFIDPANVAITESINANDVEVDGAELELTLALSPQLRVGLSYVYLDARMPLQPNPLNPCDTATMPECNLERFDVTQSPKHSGALTLDYLFSPLRFGTLALHLNVTSTEDYAYTSPAGDVRDSYMLVNGQVDLSEIKLGSHNGVLKVSAWVKNVTDEEYVVTSFSLTSGSSTQAFGTPRTAGISATYTFN